MEYLMLPYLKIVSMRHCHQHCGHSRRTDLLVTVVYLAIPSH